MIRLCIFDLDGTLSNTLQSLYSFCNTALRHCGFPLVEDLHKIQYMVGNGVHLLLERLLTASLGDYTQAQYDQLFTAYNALYAADPLHLVTEYDGVRKVLHTLSKKGIQLAVLSNKPDDMTKRVVDTLYGEIPFAVRRGQRDAFPKKPAPDGLWAILEELDCPKEDCLYIGDSDVDIQTGRNSGVATVGVTWGFRTPEELRAAGCTTLIDRPEQLLNLIGE